MGDTTAHDFRYPSEVFPHYSVQTPGMDEFLASEVTLEEELANILDTAEQPLPAAAPPAGQPARHRKDGLCKRAGRRFADLSWRRLVSFAVAAFTAVIVVVMCVLCALVSYPALRDLANGSAPRNMADLWPLLVYGPWLAGSLSVLSASLHRRRAAHSWAVVLLFSAIAVLLCTAHAPLTLSGMAVAALPPVTVLLSFHQLVRQFELPPNPPTARHAQRGDASRR